MKGFRAVNVALCLAVSILSANASSFAYSQPEIQSTQQERSGRRSSSDTPVQHAKRVNPNTPHMYPSVHPHLNKRDPVHLQTRRSASLFYTQQGNIYLQDTAMVATLDALFHWETVILDHSDYVSSVTCQPQQMNIKLNSLQSFNSAKANWTHDDTIVFVSSSPLCHTKYPGQFGYFNTTSISFDQTSLTAAAVGTQINVTQAIAEFNVVWGKWNKDDIDIYLDVENIFVQNDEQDLDIIKQVIINEQLFQKNIFHDTQDVQHDIKIDYEIVGHHTSTSSGKTSKSSSSTSSATSKSSTSTSKASTSSVPTSTTSPGPKVINLQVTSTTGSSTTSSSESSTVSSSSSSSSPSSSSGISSTTTATSNTSSSSSTTGLGFNLVAPTGTGICAQPPSPIPSPFSPYYKKLACDDTFDKGVDDFLTYLSDVANLQQYLTLWAPNTGITTTDVQSGGMRRRGTVVRRYSFGDFLSDCVHVVEAVVDAIVEAAEAALNAVVNLAESILPTWHPSISFDVPINVSPPDSFLDDSPWGDAYSIYEWHPGSDGDINYGLNLGSLAKMTGADQLITFDIDGVTQLPIPGIQLWCVDCKITGDIEVTGQATFTLPFGITGLAVKLQGTLTANMGLGLDAFASYTADAFDIRIFEVGVEGLSIPEIIAVGPYLTLDINAELKVETVGQFLAGAELHWEALGFTLDFLFPILSKGHGFAPQVTPKFKASGNVTATASLGIPLALNIGVDILDGTFTEAIALIDRPAIEAVAEYGALGTPVYADGMDPCEGILYYSDLVNEVTLEFFGQSKYDLGSWHSDKFLKGCVGDNGINTVQEALQAVPAGTTQAGCTLVTEVFKNPSFEDNGGSTFPWILDGGGAALDITDGEDDTHDGSQSLNFKNEWVRDCGAFCFGSCGFAGFCNHCCKPAAQDWTATVSQKISMCTYAQYDFQLWARVVSSEGVCTVTDIFVNNLDDSNPLLSTSWTVNHDILPITSQNKDQFPLVDNGVGFAISIPSLNNAKSYNVEVGFHVVCKNAVDFDVRIDDITLSPDDSAFNQKRAVLPVTTTSPSAKLLPAVAAGTAAPALSAVNAAPAAAVTQDAPILPAANAAPTAAAANDAPEFSYVPGANAVSGTYTVGAPIPTATAVLLGPADYNFPAFSLVMASATLGAVGLAAPTSGASASSIAAPFTGWSSLTEINGAAHLAAADDGNLYLSAGTSSSPLPGTQFYSDKSIAFKDEQNRMFHYYPDTMNAYGVSRLRLSTVMDTPLTAQLITLVPVDTPSGVAYVAADTANNNYFLTTCIAPHWQGSKVFLVKDLDSGPTELLSGQVQWIVTGNNVTACDSLVLTSAAGALTPI
ncbi:hypothetical protein DOTSEDRAFT_76094 [Dothistroma septosporum NZE10]|uniref:Uncharacterized protein n=1 Tax=Dothistroma septosporum (strain NZE10 / CBS 128990) TaxID=675120 RepID=N1PY49_DOTSN|nr:hypothetical protein DOTSEDRAFT_76094 [Dothistroma septosporum NZE10]